MAKQNPTPADLDFIIAKCDEALRAGNADEVSRVFEALTPSHVPRATRLPLAKLARRAGHVDFGLRLLTDVVHTEKGTRAEPATSAELAEYAVLLQRTGATKEAVRTLESLDARELPDVNLYLAFCYFDLWEHAKSVPHLKAYVQNAPSEYMRLVGRVNLAAAYVAESDFENAQPLLLECIELAEREKHNRLLGNCLEMLGQIHVSQKNFLAAEKELERARELLGGSRGNDELFVKKWFAVLSAFKTSSIDALKEYREEALKRGRAEEARDADLYSLAIKFSKDEFEHLYYGSPHKSYRRKIEALLGNRPTSSSYIFGASSSQILDVETGATKGSSLIQGSKVHQLLEILMRDFYRPMSAGELYSELFPGEHFNIYSSPHRVRQVEHRLRKWFEENKIPINVESRNRFCSLQVAGDFGIRVPLDRTPVDPYHSRLRALRSAYGRGQSFSALAAREITSLTRREFQAFAKQAVTAGDLNQFGAARNTVYLLKILGD